MKLHPSFHLLIPLVLSLVGCASGPYDISVDVRTDLVPGIDFVQVETRAAPEPISSAEAPQTVFTSDFSGADFIVGHRVAELEDFPSGKVYLEVRLVGPAGETVISRETIVELDDNYAVTLVLSSLCAGVLCPGDGDVPAHTACLGGACVDPRCTVEEPTYCGEPQCTVDEDCASRGCRIGVCSDRRCLLEPDGTSCSAGETCAIDGSCVPSPIDSGMPLDTGPPDTGSPDSGSPPDTTPPDTRPSTTGTFCPDEALTRGEMAVFLVRYEHGASFMPPPATGVFSDVPLSAYYAPFVEQLARDGITMGCGSGIFCPEDAVRRDQAATFTVRAQYGPSYRPKAATGVFSDVPMSNVHRNNIEQIYRDGITRGCGGDRYCPTDPLLRRHFAVFLVRLVHGSSFTPPDAVGLFSDVDTGDSQAPFIEQLAWDGLTFGCGG